MADERRCTSCGAALEGDGGASQLCAACREAGPDPAETLLDTDGPARLGAIGTGEAKRLPAPGSGALQEGARFGDYEIEGLIARGGMGAVYRARQPSLDRTVALKMVVGGAFSNEEILQRFRTEAETVGRLEHPHIVPIYDVGNEGGIPFFTMRLIEGGSLADHLNELSLTRPGTGAGPADPGAAERAPGEGAAAGSSLFTGALSPGRFAGPGAGRTDKERVVRLVVAVARALHFAHERGVLHRDIKPANILIDAQGEPQITDFGLAKQIGTDAGLTATGAVLGTPHYMSPEQAMGEEGTTASDIYSLGGVFYHLLTGSVPFPGAQAAAVIQQVIRGDPGRPSKVNPTIDRDLETICLTCLAKEPSKRYPTAAALADDLEHWLRDEPITARPTGALERLGKWCRRHPALATSAALAALSAAGFVLLLAVSEAKLQVERDTAVRKKEEAEAATAELAAVLHRLQIERAEELMERGDAVHSLAILARAVRDNPADKAAATQLLQGLAGQPLARLVGPPMIHGGAVKSARFDPAGRRLVTASADGTARVWDAVTGEPITPPLRHGKTVRTAAFDPGGGRVATASEDGTARLWDAGSGTPLAPPLEHDGEVMNLAFDPTGRLLATVSRDGHVRLWEAATGRLARAPLGGGRSLIGVAFDGGGSRVAAGGDAQKAFVWDVAGGELLHTFGAGGEVWSAQFGPADGKLLVASLAQRALLFDLGDGGAPGVRTNHQGYVPSVHFSPWGDRFATASWDRTARVWDAADGRPITPPLKHDGEVYRVRFSPGGFRVVTASADQTARVWDAGTGEPVTLPLRHGGAVRWAEFSPDGRWVATASDEGRARVWDVRVVPAINPPMTHGLPVNHAEFDPSGTLLATASEDRTARLWNPVTGAPVSDPIGLRYLADVARFSPGGDRLLVTSRNSSAFVLHGRTGAVLKKLGHSHWLYDGRWSPDGTRIVTACVNRRGHLWNALTGELISKDLRHEDAVLVVAFAPTGDRVATASKDGTARVWSAADGAALTDPLPHGSSVHHVAFSPRGNRLVTASDLEFALVWDTGDGRRALPPLRHGSQVLHAAFSPDGTRVVTTSGDGTARLWDARTGRALELPMSHRGAVNHASFDRGGLRVVTGSTDGTARVWDGRTGAPLSTPLRVGHPVLRVGFDYGGTRVVTAGMGGAQVFEIPPLHGAGPAPGWLPELAEAVAGARVDRRGILVASLPDTAPAVALGVAGVAEDGTGDAFEAWRRWYLADVTERPRSPFGTDSLADYLARRLGTGTPGALREALFAAPDDPDALAVAALSRRWLSPAPGADPGTDRLRSLALSAAAARGESQNPIETRLRPFRGLRFDGDGDRAVIPNLPLDEIVAGGDALTVEVWVWNWTGPVLAQGLSGDPENSLFLSVGDGLSVGYESGRGRNHMFLLKPPPAFSWLHLALVYGRGRMRVYANGECVADRPAARPGPFHPRRDFLLGANQEVDGPIFGSGVIRAVHLSNVERYPGPESFQPEWDPHPDTSSVLLLDAARTEGPRLPDQSGHGRDARIEGAVPVSFGPPPG